MVCCFPPFAHSVPSTWITLPLPLWLSKPKPKHYLLYEAFPDTPAGSCLPALGCHPLCTRLRPLLAGPPYTAVKVEHCTTPGGAIHIDPDENGTLWRHAAQVLC